MRRLQYNIVIEFFDKDGKFKWALEEECCMGAPTEKVKEACEFVYETFGVELDWTVDIISTDSGSGIEELKAEVEKLSKTYQKHKTQKND